MHEFNKQDTIRTHRIHSIQSNWPLTTLLNLFLDKIKKRYSLDSTQAIPSQA